MSLVGRQVSSVRLHAATHMTKVGNLGPNVSKDKDPTGVKGKLKMEVVEHGILVKANGQELVLVTGNMISYELEPMVEAPKGAAAAGIADMGQAALQGQQGQAGSDVLGSALLERITNGESGGTGSGQAG